MITLQRTLVLKNKTESCFCLQLSDKYINSIIPNFNPYAISSIVNHIDDYTYDIYIVNNRQYNTKIAYVYDNNTANYKYHCFGIRISRKIFSKTKVWKFFNHHDLFRKINITFHHKEYNGVVYPTITIHHVKPALNMLINMFGDIDDQLKSYKKIDDYHIFIEEENKIKFIKEKLNETY